VFGVKPELVQTALTSLAEIFTVCAKHDLVDASFRLAIADVKLADDAEELLAETYAREKKRLRSSLLNASMQLPHYHNLDRRLDIQIASRAARQQVQPKLVLELETRDAAAAPQFNLMELDFANLSHLCNELENAVTEIQQGHSRRILRYVQ
jgi:hypothetical protein